MEQRVRVLRFTVSQHGCGTREEQTLERPFGHADLHARNVEPDDIVTVDQGVVLCSCRDPDGNTITPIGSFREHD